MATGVTEDQVQQAKAAHRSGATSTDPMMKRSKDSASMIAYWDKVDAITDGIEAVSIVEEYLPKFVDEETTDYTFRRKMTKMTNVYSDGLEGLASKPFEQEITLLNNDTNPFIDDVDGSGNTMHVFAGDVFFNGINNALDWIFVDYSKPLSKPGGAALNRNEAKQAGQRAYWSHVLARNVLDVQSKVIAGKETLTYFKVFEPGDPDHIREFKRSVDGIVTWTLYRWQDDIPPDSDSHYVPIESGEISIGVIPMEPFVTGRRNGRTWKVLPPMKNAADLQIELFQQESGLKYAKTLTAYPMLAANGITAEKNADGKPKKLRIGPGRVLYSGMDAGTGKVGSWGYVEPSAESLKFLADDVDRTILQLRELLRQPLTAGSSNITVITAAVAAGKARSAVKQWGLQLKNTLENALKMVALYEGDKTYDPKVHVFIEFDDYNEGDDLTALQDGNSRNKISDETYREELKRRGVLSSNFTEARETDRLLKQLPTDNAPDMTPI